MTEQRPLPSEQQVAAVYRQLADDYSLARASANRERTWQRIELKWSLQRKGALQPRSAIAQRARARLVGYAVAALALAVVCVFLLWPHSVQLEYAVRGGPVSTGNMGRGWVVTAEQVATLDFTDGSELGLASDTALNVNALGPHSAFTRLARGSVHVAVEHHDDTRWTFLAGPYEVRVEGTKFDLSWQAERFELSMQEGRVRVVGPDQREWVLERGESLVVPSSDMPSSDMPSSDIASSDIAGSDIAGSDIAGSDARAPQPEPATSLPQQSAAVPGDDANDDEAVATTSPAGHARDWSRLLRNGRFSEIVSDARRAGLSKSVKGRPIGDVAALAQAARYTGDSGLAEDCWKAIRARAPGSSDAHQSAFFLGRVMEQQGRRADAIHWFQRYREESPGGVYAGQALGRQMVLTGGHGRSRAARGLAEDYLARFPNGPYAKAAKAVLGEGTATSGVGEADDALSGE